MKKTKIIKALVLSSISLIFASLTFTAQATLPTGRKIPNFSLPTQNGNSISYRPHFQNKVTLLVLSNYCSVELAGVWAIPFYYRFYQHSDFKFAFVFSDKCLPGFIPQRFIKSSMQNAADSLKLPYILMDWDNKISSRLHGDAKHPQIYLINRQGQIVWQKKLTDPRYSTQELDKTIHRLLGQNP